MTTIAGIRFLHESEHEHMEQTAEEQGKPQPSLELAH